MNPCSKCGGPRENSGRYCRKCQAEYMREWRKTHPPSEEQRARGDARSYARTYKRRGLLIPEPCEDCGLADDPEAGVFIQMHHEDYGKPLDVTWLCRSCHRLRHAAA